MVAPPWQAAPPALRCLCHLGHGASQAPQAGATAGALTNWSGMRGLMLWRGWSRAGVQWRRARGGVWGPVFHHSHGGPSAACLCSGQHARYVVPPWPPERTDVLGPPACVHALAPPPSPLLQARLSGWRPLDPSGLPCGPSPGLHFWLSQLLATGTPDRLLHCLLFPLVWGPGAAAVYILHTMVALAFSGRRCTALLQRCPAAGTQLMGAHDSLSSTLSLFSATRRQLRPDGPLQACHALDAWCQLAGGLLPALHLVWWLHRACQLRELAKKEGEEAVRQEWELERTASSWAVVALELAATSLLAWQAATGLLAVLG